MLLLYRATPASKLEEKTDAMASPRKKKTKDKDKDKEKERDGEAEGESKDKDASADKAESKPDARKLYQLGKDILKRFLDEKATHPVCGCFAVVWCLILFHV